jgi:hypothetical protein
LEQYTYKLLKAKIVEPSTSPWNCPALLIRKANYDASRSDDLSMYRMIVDFRKANLQVAGSYQPLVDSQSIFHQIGEAKGRYFTSFDMAVSFYQVPLAEESRSVTAFSTKSQHLQFTKTPMGLESSSCAFLAAFYDLFRAELRTNFSVYVDVGLIYHADFGQHLSFLRHIFAKLMAA